MPIEIETWTPPPSPPAPSAKPVHKHRRAIYTGVAFAGLLVITIAVMGRHEIAAAFKERREAALHEAETARTNDNRETVIPLDPQASAPPPTHPLTPAEHSPTLP